jgi:hypothetical protein
MAAMKEQELKRVLWCDRIDQLVLDLNDVCTICFDFGNWEFTYIFTKGLQFKIWYFYITLEVDWWVNRRPISIHARRFLLSA